MFRQIVAVVSLLVVIASSCSVEVGQIGSQRLSGERAQIVAEFDAEPYLLSPTGDAVLLEAEADTPSGLAMCVVELENEVERFCIDDPHIVLSIGSRVWSPDGREVVLSSRSNPDIFVVDMFTGAIDALTDDGVIETTPEDLGLGPIDELPVFTPSRNGIVFVRQGLTGELSLMLYDRSAARIVGQVDLPAEVIRSFTPPLVLDERRALIGGSDKVFEVDFESDAAREVFDYSSTFRPNTDEFGFPSTRVLAPVDQLDDGRLVLYDAGTLTVLNQTGGDNGGYSSGMYIGDPATGTLVPIFETGPIDQGWLGPMTLTPAGENQYIVSWLDQTREIEDLAVRFVHTLSLLDLDVHELPVDPNQLPPLWDDNGEAALTPISPTPGYTVPISARSTLAVGAWGGRTIVLEFPQD